MFAVVLTATLVASALADISQNCLYCICQVEGCESQIGQCQMDMGSLSCGPFQIKEPYWIDCGQPGGDWQSCTTQMDCSITCVEAYLQRYGTYCTGGSDPTCEDYARIHNGGPNGCNNPATLGYWDKVSGCCQGGCGAKIQPLKYVSKVKKVKAFDSFREEWSEEK